jgi:4'-phosphopantetheinyl transferase
MPLSFKLDSDKEIELAIWKITEDTSYFHNKLNIHKSEESIIEEFIPKKLMEWLASRYLLHLMSGRGKRGIFSKDIHGKPHLDDSNYHVSISHSIDLVAVVASEHLVGIDIQYYVPKIYRIKHKFVNENELISVPENKSLEALHVIWGAKESLYKAYGKKSLDFKKNILIKGLDLTKDHGEFQGKVIKGDYIKDFIIKFILFEKFTIVYAKESN